ncbi:MAG: LacI family DNA-binding transcriptional regulator [Fimbriimonas sp.]|nr:LacI family DNA-binding transcriptional regulator [Fimbriimonas sp.]
MSEKVHLWTKNKSATLKDVALDVGVSESLVSFVLNGSRSGARVSEETRMLIVEAGSRLGYRPNALARSLNTGRTERLGVYSSRARIDARNMFFADLIGGISERARETGMNVVIHASGDGTKKLLDLVSNRAIDGLLVYAAHNDPILRFLGQLVVPAVALADKIESLPSAVVDDKGGGTLQAQHLWQLGHRHVLLKQSNMTPSSARDRMLGFAETAEGLGMTLSWSYEEPLVPEGVNSDDVALLTRRQNRATALVGWHDATAEAACHKLTSLGISIPGDVAVVGFDGFTKMFAPKYELTTICAHWDRVGYSAAKTLTDMIEGKRAPEVTVQPVDFVRGKTT